MQEVGKESNSWGFLNLVLFSFIFLWKYLWTTSIVAGENPLPLPLKDSLVGHPQSGCSSRISWSNWNLEKLVLRREEYRSTQRKTSQSKAENQQQTQPNNHCWDLNPGIIRGRQVFSPLRHPCFHNPSFTMGVNLGLISFYRSRWWVKGG